MRVSSLTAVGAAAVLASACARSAPLADLPAPEQLPIQERTVRADRTGVRAAEPAVPPQLAMFAGLLPLRSTDADRFRATYQTYDGRGVLIAVLDSGVDPSLAGMQRTTTGERKLIDLRDFSDEGAVGLEPIDPGGASVAVQDLRISGFGRVRGLSAGPYFGGVFREITLGAVPSGDLNGDGDLDDNYAVVVAKASDGWVALVDTDGDGSLDGERPLRDYAVQQESFTFRSEPARDGPIGIALNLTDDGGRPRLKFVMDNSSHGSHVAGIAAGHDLFGVQGFDGVAPGAQVLGLKIANNTRGGISLTGTMIAAMEYAAEYAAQRNRPLVINLSYGIGNAVEGTAVIDSLIDDFALAHPNVLVVISAGNDGPGLSTVGLPGSATQALTVCALFPGVFAEPPQPGQAPRDDVVGWWSARGGEVAKPDLCAPGVAFSNVPRWRMGEEVSAGTSMAAPQIAGGAALLLSGLVQRGLEARAVDLRRALVTTARPLRGTTVLDGGTGVAHIPSAFEWLQAAHQTGTYDVRARPMGGSTSRGSAAIRRSGLQTPSDTVQTFEVESIGGQPAARLLLGSDVNWISGPAVIEPSGGPITVDLAYDRSAFREPGVYVGTVWARPATDSLGGALFGLTNTVVVPHQLDRPIRRSGMLTPGAAARYFLAVPPGASGLSVGVALSDPARDATLYLFEPDGAPHRGGSSMHTAGTGRAEVQVAVEDLQPGVYEAVIVAPPAVSVSYQFRAEAPALEVGVEPADLRLRLRNADPEVRAGSIAAAVVGTRQTLRAGTRDGGASVLEVAVPDGAGTLALEVTLTHDLWRRLTDFGVTVFDASGRKLSDGPLHYPVGRQSVPVETYRPGDTLLIELMPAFADVNGDHAWEAVVRADFLHVQPNPLQAEWVADGVFRLEPGARADFTFGVTDSVAAGVEQGDLMEFAIQLDGGTSVTVRAAVEER